MSFVVIFLLCFTTYVVRCDNLENNYNLDLIQVLFRHGERTPIDCESRMLQAVSNASSYDPWGYGELTNRGMMQEYEIGQMLRRTYDRFLPKLYKSEHVYAHSSGTSRTKNSLALVLAALFPPAAELRWNEHLNWMPINIFTDPRPLDVLNKPRDCVKFKKYLDDMINSTELKPLVAEHEEVTNIVGNIYGQKFDLGDLFCIYNALFIQKNLKLNLPEWYNDDIYAKLQRATKFHFETLSYNSDLKRLNGGTFVRRMLENIRKSLNESNRRKIYLYSSHDKNLHAFARAHDLDLAELPDYGSAIVLEKYSDDLNKHYVKLSMWFGFPKKLSTLKLKNCEEMCPLDEYTKLIDPVLPSDEEMMCLFQNLEPKDIQRILTTDTSAIDS
ncbi:hypothetical protein TKK_0002172 [Trichogramma kaykai]|uniref:acid phosphatase n=1 Tax=Trichogramma kaykai TaxID=54128 RepID=A0ABD2XAT7_9HYME